MNADEGREAEGPARADGAGVKPGLARVARGTLSTGGAPLSIGALEQALLARFPKEDAESWDRTGLLVGDRSKSVTGVACALDPTISAIEEAAEAGANVLLTHHPAFLDPPPSFGPAASVALNPGAGVYRAIELGVALMNFHTALDVSAEAQRMLPGMLGLRLLDIVEKLESDPRKGYGQLCSFAEENLTLSQLASRCTSVFERQPRVWGDAAKTLKTVVTCTGSAGSCGREALRMHADCLIAGEVKYHDALDLSAAGLAIIDLGHDASELPFANVLARAACDAGVPGEGVIIVGRQERWTCPDTVRL